MNTKQKKPSGGRNLCQNLYKCWDFGFFCRFFLIPKNYWCSKSGITCSCLLNLVYFHRFWFQTLVSLRLHVSSDQLVEVCRLLSQFQKSSCFHMCFGLWWEVMWLLVVRGYVVACGGGGCMVACGGGGCVVACGGGGCGVVWPCGHPPTNWLIAPVLCEGGVPSHKVFQHISLFSVFKIWNMFFLCMVWIRFGFGGTCLKKCNTTRGHWTIGKSSWENVTH